MGFHWAANRLGPGLALAALLGSIGSSETAVADGLRCETKLVGPGDSLYDVKTLCGPPDDATQRTERRAVRRLVDAPCANGLGRCPYVVEAAVEVRVDEWTYDFGRQRFIQYLTFEDGKLVTVKSGGYGHKL